MEQLNGLKIPLAIDSATILSGVVAFTLLWQQVQGLAEELTENRADIPKKVVVLETELENIKEDVKEIRTEQKEQRKLSEQILREVSKP